MNLLSKVTPWPWSVPHFIEATDPNDCRCGYILSETLMGSVAVVSKRSDDCPSRGGGDHPSHDEACANGRLLQLAPDHALLLAAITRGVYMECPDEAGYVSVCVNADEDNWQDFREPELDPFGCPILTPELRAELRKALGLVTDSLST